MSGPPLNTLTSDGIDTPDLPQALAALRDSNARYRVLADTMLHGVVHQAADGRIIAMNPAAERILGKTCAEMLGTTSEQAEQDTVREDGSVFPASEHPAMIALATGQVVRGVVMGVYNPREQQRRWIRIDAVPLMHESFPNPVEAYTVFEDITDRRIAELALREADEQKNRFIATLAHELRNPLAPLGNVVALLQDPISAARLHWCRDIIERQVTQMSRLLDDLLDLSRITHGKITLQREEVTLTAMLERGIEMARPAIEARRHDLVVDAPSERMHVHGDMVRLAQVCCNLLTNAAKYTDAGGIITLRIRRDGLHAVIEVEDTGVGIVQADLERVFGMFSQVDATRVRSGDGLGIGLALVKGIVELHGGEVEARSAGLGHGSTFAVRLPLAM